MEPAEKLKAELGDVIAALLCRHREKWLKIVLRIVGNPEDAEDVLQESIRRVLRRNLHFSSADEVRMYLSRTICNTAIETYHALRRERTRRLPLLEHTLAQPEDLTPHTSLERRERVRERERLLELLREGLAALPPKQYEAVRLTMLDPSSSSIREAGQERGIPYSTLRHRCLQGLRGLKRYLNRALRARDIRLVLT